jgi:hypothetical protein
MAKLISGRLRELNVGIVSFSENTNTLNVVGISSFGDVILNGSVGAGGTTGTNGQYLQSTGVGVTWASAATIRTENNYVATAGQTTFSLAYTIGLIDVYFNGVRLTDSEYTASNGTSVVLNEAAFGGESVDIIAYTSSGSVSSGSGGLTSESDTLDSVTSRGNLTNNNISVGILTATGSLYVDTIRRRTDNSTNTKIAFDAGSLKLYAGNGTTPKVSINGGVGIATNLNVTGIATASSFVKSGGTSNQFLKADGSSDSSTYLTTTGSGSNLTGIVTSIVAGTGISINQSTGNVTISASGSGEGSWTLTPGAGTYSFTVPANANYVMWVRGNIPNGICVWNATVSITNTNVPVIGNQYGWYYVDGNALVLTSIPSQIIGTSGSIITTSPAVSNSNIFSFGITNNSASNQTVYYGYKEI